MGTDFDHAVLLTNGGGKFIDTEDTRHALLLREDMMDWCEQNGSPAQFSVKMRRGDADPFSPIGLYAVFDNESDAALFKMFWA